MSRNGANHNIKIGGVLAKTQGRSIKKDVFVVLFFHILYYL